MAQVIEQTGGAKQAGIAAGIQKALQGELNLEHQKELDDYRVKLNLEAAKQRMAIKEQFDIEAEARAYKVAIDKMEYASMLDFEQEERDRLRDKATFNAGIKTIDENDGLTDEQRNAAKFNLATKYTHIPEAAPYLGLKPTSTGLFNFGGEEAPPLPGTPVPTVNNPLGLNIENIPVAKLPEAVLSLEAQNKFEVISPEGKTETIDANQWPEKKAQGYVLATIKRLQTTKALRRAAQASYPKIQP